MVFEEEKIKNRFCIVWLGSLVLFVFMVGFISLLIWIVPANLFPGYSEDDSRTTQPPRSAHHKSHHHTEENNADHILPPSCGNVTGDKDATISLFPWQVRVIQKQNMRESCGGSIVSTKHIITVSECVGRGLRTQPKDLIVKVGDFDPELHDEYEEELLVSDISIHPDYDSDTRSNGIALLTVTQSIHFNQHVSPICIPQTHVTHPVQCFVSGGSDINRHLFNAPIDLLDENKCKSIYGDDFDSGLQCAGQAEVCDRNAGAPVSCLESDGRYYLYGMTTMGVDCGRKDLPAMFIKVAKHRHWIMSQIITENSKFKAMHHDSDKQHQENE